MIPGSPARRLTALDVAALIVGMVVGAGIFRVPAAVAAAAGEGGAALVLAIWAVGGLAALAGALCYAELATRFPSLGGEYHFLRLAFGPRLAALFVWARIAVIQTGSIATVAFVAADHAAAALPDGPAPAWWAGIAVLAVTLMNLAGIAVGRSVQRLLVAAVLLALLAVIAAPLLSGPLPVAAAAPPPGGGIGLALVFVMLAYGGWNEAAYLSAEVKGTGRALVRALVGGIGLVAILYLAVNAAMLAALGAAGLAATPAPAAVIAAAAYGPAGALVLGAAVIAASLSTMNATTITGARAMCAAGDHIPALRPLARWDDGRSVPVPAIIAQGVVALLLTAYGATARDGFSAMVAFGAPVFWLFLALVALALFRLRARPAPAGSFAVPGWPLVPLLFLGACLFMLWSSVDYARFMLDNAEGGRLAGVLGMTLLLAGLPLAWRAR